MIIDRSQLAAALPAYELKDRLGAGAFGLVLAARHRNLERDVAIKVLPAESEAARVRFATEARLLASMDHPHIVRVYDYVERDEFCLIIMELLAGGSLTSRLHHMSPQNTCAAGVAIAEALSYAHSHGVLHRDIKPDNVLFGASNELKVADFGIAKIFEGSATTASAITGTPLYMAPEQIGGGQLGPATDIYALGVVLYEMMNGAPPFDAALPLVERYRQQLATTPAPPSGIPPVIADVIMHALGKDETARPSSAHAFAIELASAADSIYGRRRGAQPTGRPVNDHSDDSLDTLDATATDVPPRQIDESSLTQHNASIAASAVAPSTQAPRERRVSGDAPVRVGAIGGLDYLGTLAFSPDGRILAIRTFTMGAGAENGKVTLWDIADAGTPTRAATLAHRSNSLYAMAFAPTGNRIATTGFDGSVDKRNELIIWNFADLQRPERAFVQNGLGMIRATAFSPDGHALLTAGSGRPNSSAGEMTMWDLAYTARARFLKSRLSARGYTFHPPSISAAMFSSDGRILATAAGATVMLWDVTDRKQPIHLTSISGPFDHMHTIAISPDNRMVACADHTHGGRVTLWDIADLAFPPRLITELTDLATLDQYVSFSPDGRILATASGGRKGSVFSHGDMVLWDMADYARPSRITALKGLYHPRAAAFSPDGRMLATSGGVEGSVVLWNISGIRATI